MTKREKKGVELKKGVARRGARDLLKKMHQESAKKTDKFRKPK